jgi:hypothetical protein
MQGTSLSNQNAYLSLIKDGNWAARKEESTTTRHLLQKRASRSQVTRPIVGAAMMNARWGLAKHPRCLRRSRKENLRRKMKVWCKHVWLKSWKRKISQAPSMLAWTHRAILLLTQRVAMKMELDSTQPKKNQIRMRLK